MAQSLGTHGVGYSTGSPCQGSQAGSPNSNLYAHQAISEPVPHPKFPAELLVLHLLPIALPTDKEQHGKMVLGLKEQPTRVDS